jgi:hypothetical protein
MLWPTSTFPGKVLLLSEPNNFNATYLRRTLELYGTTVISACDIAGISPGALSDEDAASIVACVAIDQQPDAVKALTAMQTAFPILFVGGYPGVPMPSAYTWMQAPFASFQVIERLMGLVIRAQNGAAASE